MRRIKFVVVVATAMVAMLAFSGPAWAEDSSTLDPAVNALLTNRSSEDYEGFWEVWSRDTSWFTDGNPGPPEGQCPPGSEWCQG